MVAQTTLAITWYHLSLALLYLLILSVLLGVSSDIFINDRSGVGTPTNRTFEKRTIPYRLHSDGAAPSEPLYPLERCMVASNDVILSGGGPSSNTAFVGSAWPGGATAQMATGPDGTCIVGVAYAIEAVSNMPSSGLFQIAAYPDPAGPEKFIWVPMSSAIVAGQVIFVAIPGCVAVTTSIAGIAATSVTYTGMYYIGMPGL